MPTLKKRLDVLIEMIGKKFISLRGDLYHKIGLKADDDQVIHKNSTLEIKAGPLQAQKHITTGGTSNDFVKGDGSLDATEYSEDTTLTKLYVPEDELTTLDEIGVVEWLSLNGFTKNKNENRIIITVPSLITCTINITSPTDNTEYTEGDDIVINTQINCN